MISVAATIRSIDSILRGELPRPRAHTTVMLACACGMTYGAAMGSLYALARSQRPRNDAVASGMAFGIAVWAVSYLGLLPALKLYRSATEEPTERNVLMIGAHLVWGASLGLLADR